MRTITTIGIFAFLVLVAACGSQAGQNSSAMITSTPAAAATPIPTPVMPKNGDYPGKGKVTKINLELGSVELDHEEIKGVMPPMRMEFYVTDKKQIEPLRIGDNVDFTLRYKDRTETIIDIKKSKMSGGILI